MIRRWEPELMGRLYGAVGLGVVWKVAKLLLTLDFHPVCGSPPLDIVYRDLTLLFCNGEVPRP